MRGGPVSVFERDCVELGWWVAMHRAVEDSYAPLGLVGWLVNWWRTF